MTMQISSLEIKKMYKSLTPGIIAGVITLFCGATASILSPANGAIAALTGSSLGAAGATILRKRKDNQFQEEISQKIRYTLSAEVKHSISLVNQEIQTLKGELDQVKSQLISSNATSVIKPKKKPILHSKTEYIYDKITNNPIDTTDNTKIINWLNTHNLQVDKYHQPVPLDDVFDRIACTIGEQYAILAPLYHQIIRSLRNKGKFSFSLAKSSQEEIAICTQFCQTLLQNSLLADYFYDKQQKLISATPQTGNADINSFLNGGWFERFIYHKVAKFLTAHQLDYQCLRNPQVILRNRDSFELDLLFLVNNKLIWIECKSGQQSSSCLGIYSARRKALTVSKNRAFIVGLKLSDAQTESWTNIWDITVANCNNLLNHISKALELPEDLDS
jgi:hypothetical protein